MPGTSIKRMQFKKMQISGVELQIDYNYKHFIYF